MPKAEERSPKLVPQPHTFPNQYRDEIATWENVPPSEATNRFIEKRDLNRIQISTKCKY